MNKQRRNEILNELGDGDGAELRELMAQIDELEDEALRWIPVSEQSPEDGYHVLVCDDKGYMYLVYYEEESGNFFYNDCDDVCLKTITHWMLLPDGPATSKEHHD